MNQRNTFVTNNKWSTSTTHRGGDNFVTLNVIRHYPDMQPDSHGFTFRIRRGDGDGLQFPSVEDADKWACEHGYLQRYSRNTCGFCRSRAWVQRNPGKMCFAGYLFQLSMESRIKRQKISSEERR